MDRRTEELYGQRSSFSHVAYESYKLLIQS